MPDNMDWFHIPGDHRAVIILGMGPQALFMARALHGRYEKVYLVGEKNWIGYLSRYGKKIVVSKSQLKACIIGLLSKHGGQTPILISGGSTLSYYIRNTWMHKLNCYPKPLEAIHILNDKERLYDYIKQENIGLNLIKSFPFNEEPPRDNEFPLILKWRSDPVSGQFKTLIINGVADYLDAFGEYSKQKSLLVLQEYFPNKLSFAYAAYAINGIPQKHIVAEQVRQYPPGLTSFVQPFQNEIASEIQYKCENLLQRFKYSGFIEFEFLMSKDSDKPFLLECNPRPWGWMDYLRHYGKKQKGVKMSNLLRDILAVKKNSSSWHAIAELKDSLLAKKTIWNLSDPLPIIGQILNTIKNSNE